MALGFLPTRRSIKDVPFHADGFFLFFIFFFICLVFCLRLFRSCYSPLLEEKEESKRKWRNKKNGIMKKDGMERDRQSTLRCIFLYSFILNFIRPFFFFYSSFVFLFDRSVAFFIVKSWAAGRRYRSTRTRWRRRADCAFRAGKEKEKNWEEKKTKVK